MAVSAAIVAAVLLLVGAGWLVSLRSHVTSYAYSAGPLRQIDLRLSSGEAVIVGTSASTVQVRRTDHYSFGHPARERRTYAGTVLAITSSCHRILVGSCSASYELAVPETVAVDVETTAGSVRLDGFRGEATVHTGSGNVDAEAYCGFNLAATSHSGDLRVATACTPQHLWLHSGSGSAVALVPPGRYRIDASGSSRRVTGVTPDPSAPFSLDVHSDSASVTVGSGL